MTRGNQRDLARAKNAKKNAKGGGAANDEGNKGTTLEARKERDAEVMRQKQLKKANAAKEGENSGKS